MSELGLGSDLSDWVQQRADELVEEWRHACSLPSVSADGPEAVAEMASWLARRAEPVFDRVESLSGPGSAPVLLGRRRGTGPARLLLYTHYDVVPAGAGWTHDPFGAELVDGHVYARGVGDDKADVMARLHALEAWRATRGELPFTVIWLSEGMEEVGSPGLREVIAEHREAIEADGCLWESYYRSIDGESPTIGFGSRGVLTVELVAALLDADTHSAMAGVYRSSAQMLAQAVASLVDADGRVRIPGFYDAIRPFTERDALTVARTPAPAVQDGARRRGALWSEDPEAIVRRWLYEPSFNLASMHAGPAGAEHEATVLPACARARIDIRLMPDQDPARLREALERHLRDEGFPGVQVVELNAIPPAASDPDSSLALVVRRACAELFGAEPLLHPVVPGSGPLHLFTSMMTLDAVMPPGTIRPDSGMHGPDENARVSHYLDEVKLTLRIFELLADTDTFGVGEGAG